MTGVCFSCSDESESPNPDSLFVKAEPDVAIALDFNETESQTVTIESNGAWEVENLDDATWLSLSKRAGEGNSTLELTAEANNTDAVRETRLRIFMSDNTAKADTIHVVQNWDVDVFKAIEDKNFRTYCNQYDTNGDGKLSVEEADKVTYIDLTPEYEDARKLVISLKGIEYFKNLVSLSCNTNLIEKIDLTGNPKIKEVLAVSNKLESIDVSKCPELERLYVSDNPDLTQIDVTHNPKLKELFAEYNGGIASIDLTKCSELTAISLPGNKLTEINLSKNAKLVNISLSENQLTSIDVTNMPDLERLNINRNKISGNLDVTKNHKLIVLNVGDNAISSLDVTNCPEMNSLYVTSNKLTSIDVSKNPKLSSFHCSNNLFTKVDISACPEMVQFLCTTQPNLEEVDISNCRPGTLVSFWCIKNPKLKTIWVWKGFTGVPTDQDWIIGEGIEFKEKK